VDVIWKALLLIIMGVLLLRVAGRKSISQMTISTTIIMISIGTLIVQPIANRSVWKAGLAAGIFIAVLILLEYLQLKFNVFEKFLSGSSKVVIENGQLHEKNLKKLRFTVDKLEMRLRQSGISNISDVLTATLEPNGQLGYELKRYAKPVTIGEMERMLANLMPPPQSGQTIFEEISQKGNQKPIPPKLQ
jgi:uncharacterized membrane protein YcaP (DUF421 family)